MTGLLLVFFLFSNIPTEVFAEGRQGQGLRAALDPLEGLLGRAQALCGIFGQQNGAHCRVVLRLPGLVGGWRVWV